MSNPLDFTAGYWGNEKLLTPMFSRLMAGEVDAGMLVVDYPPHGAPYQAGSAHAAMDRALAAAGKATGKPVFHASVNSGGITPDASEALIAQGIVPLQGLHDAAEVIAKWVAHCARVRADGGAVPPGLAPVMDAVMAIAAHAADNIATLTELDVNPLMVFEDVAVDALIVEVPRQG